MATIDMSEFLELLIELSALERLRDSWVSEVSRDDNWRSRISILNSMIERRLIEREQTLKDCEVFYPELKQMGFGEPIREFDA